MPPKLSDLCDPVRLDLINACLWRGVQRIPLRPKTFAVLQCLLAHRGQLVTKAALLDAVWPEITVNDVALMICIRELRQALGDDPKAPRFIETLHRRGYRFVGDLPVTAPLSGSPSSAVHYPVPPVGREAELTRLHAWLATALCGVRQVVFVTDEAGRGKTALVEAFMAELGTYGALWIGQGQCVEHYGAGEAYLPVLEALGRLCWGPGGQEVVALLEQQAPTWLVQMHQGLVAIMATGQRVVRARYLVLLAEAVGRAGQVAEGLRLLAEAWVMLEESKQGQLLAETHRVQGELLLRQAVPNVAQAEACFQQALAVARHQQAKSWELRAAMSLSRLWQSQGKHIKVYSLLAPIYSWFTEGFDTPDLQEAKALLTELAETRGSSRQVSGRA